MGRLKIDLRPDALIFLPQSRFAMAEKCAFNEILLGVCFGSNAECLERPLSGALIF